MILIAPTPLPTRSPKSLFLAGGITGCPDWQSMIMAQIDSAHAMLLNPRRDDFPIGDPTAAEKQIRWEHEALRYASGILFWFPCETICPIVLYELGAWSMTTKPIFVGVHPDYQRKQDVLIQTKLARPEVQVHQSFESLVDDVKAWLP